MGRPEAYPPAQLEMVMVSLGQWWVANSGTSFYRGMPVHLSAPRGWYMHQHVRQILYGLHNNVGVIRRHRWRV